MKYYVIPKKSVNQFLAILAFLVLISLLRHYILMLFGKLGFATILATAAGVIWVAKKDTIKGHNAKKKSSSHRDFRKTSNLP